MTERRRPRLDLGNLEWKLAVTTVLAFGYVALWLGLEVPSTTPASHEPSLANAPRIVRSPVARPRRIKTRSS